MISSISYRTVLCITTQMITPLLMLDIILKKLIITLENDSLILIDWFTVD